MYKRGTKKKRPNTRTCKKQRQSNRRCTNSPQEGKDNAQAGSIKWRRWKIRWWWSSERTRCHTNPHMHSILCGCPYGGGGCYQVHREYHSEAAVAEDQCRARGGSTQQAVVEAAKENAPANRWAMLQAHSDADETPKPQDTHYANQQLFTPKRNVA